MANIEKQITAIQLKIGRGETKNKWAALNKVKHLEKKLAAEKQNKSWLTYISK